MKRVRSDHRSSLSKLLHIVMMTLHHEEGQERSQEFSIQTIPHSNDDPPYMKRVRSDHRSSLSKLLHTVMMTLHHEEGQERSQEFSILSTPHSNDDPPP